MSSYAEALQDFYRGEAPGEAVYSALLGSARNDDERLKLGTLLQLETETKAWLRAPMVARGVSLEEQSAVREDGAAVTEQLKPMSWSELMQALHHVIVTEYVPRYQGHADAAKARGRADEEAVSLTWSSMKSPKLNSPDENWKGQAWVNHLRRRRYFKVPHSALSVPYRTPLGRGRQRAKEKRPRCFSLGAGKTAPREGDGSQRRLRGNFGLAGAAVEAPTDGRADVGD